MTTLPSHLADDSDARPPMSGETRPPASGTDPAFTLSDTDFDAIARRIRSDTGIVITDAKRSMVVARLSHRLRRLGLSDFASYARLLESPAGREEREALVSAITTNVTRFFREPHHFEALVRLLPDLRRKAASGGRVRLWSAGCSTGQEAYSIAATLLDHAPDMCRQDLRILATDIDPAVVQQAKAGEYRLDGLGPEVPAQFGRHLKENGRTGTAEVSPALRELVRFEVLNLLEPWPFGGSFDVVFCRNVVIYFDAPTRLALWERLAERIPAGGTLFVGHSERMDPRLDPLFEPSGITQYRRTSRSLAPAAMRQEGPHETERKSACRSGTP